MGVNSIDAEDDQVVHRYDAQMLNESTDEEEIKVKCPYCGRKMCEGQIHSFNSGMEIGSVLADVSIARRSSYLMNERKTDVEMGEQHEKLFRRCRQTVSYSGGER